MNEDSINKQKTWQVHSFGKINVFTLHLNDSREGFSQRGRGRSFHVDGPETEEEEKEKKKKKKGGTNSAVSGARNLEAESIRSRTDSTSL